jgi:hypothetical protein
MNKPLVSIRLLKAGTQRAEIEAGFAEVLVLSQAEASKPDDIYARM